MNAMMKGHWGRLGLVAMGLTALFSLVAMWTAMTGLKRPPDARSQTIDRGDRQALESASRSLRDVFARAVNCTGDAGAAMARTQASALPASAAQQELEARLKDCAGRRLGLSGIYLLSAQATPGQPKASARSIAGREAFGEPAAGFLDALAAAAASGRVSYAALPDAALGRSAGLDQLVPLQVQPPRVVVLRHRLSDMPPETLLAAGGRHALAFVVKGGADARGVPMPSMGGIHLVADGHSLLPEWALGSQGIVWLLTGLTIALLGATLVSIKLAEQSERFRSDVEQSSPVGLRAIDHEGRILWANPAFITMSGWPEDKVIGALPPFAFWAADELSERDDQLRSIIGGQLPDNTYTASFNRPDQSKWYARVTVQPLTSRPGWMLACTDITREVTEARRAAGMLQRLSSLHLKDVLFRQLDLKIHKHASVASACARDCSTAVQRLRQQKYPLALEAAVVAEEVAKKSSEGAQYLLHASRPEKAQPVALNEVVEDGMAAAGQSAQGSNVQFVNGVAKDLPMVTLPRETLTSIVSNLLHNSIRAMADQKIAERHLTVLSEQSDDGTAIRIKIQDRGCGIAAGVDPFAPGGKGHADGHGVGLGDSLAQLKDWGGRLELLHTATQGVLRGTTMQLTLPLRLPDEGVTDD